ncbi:PREDICTED: uncharacterized protein LOC101304797 [Fragaria vesca subsp. vesca]|uniref:uncharacterized protein LOC101304797 n=1 Tax=Fragaria vesca subsp. vesca TaxID=101020 RepID=UPI0002C334A1|nr:PREDICTED: uncharacterized protein LOC101304797 [Fragaria vesca subsp. vesca]
MEYVDEVVDYSDTKEEVIHLAPVALDDTLPQVRDPISQVDVGTAEKPLLISISAKLAEDEKETLLALLCEYRDCFADKYEDMPGLSPDLVCHRLPTYPDRRPVRQDGRFMRTETLIVVKEEIESMHRSGIIRVAKYNEWLSNVVPVRKKNGKMRVCVDYRDLNNATPKDIYPMHVADLLIDAAAGHEVLSFMDGTAGYHQIPVAEEDLHKTAFRCLGFAGAFEYVVMPFGLKNAGATYQRAMNLIFHDILGKLIEVYIDDVVVKTKTQATHIEDLRQVFTRMHRHNLKMNPAKCVFFTEAGDFLGFLVHQRGIEIPKDKAQAVITASPPNTKKELQQLLGRIKDYLTNPPVLIPPRDSTPLKLYIAAADLSIGGLLAQDDVNGVEHAVYYLSRVLTECETRYSPMEKLCLALYFAGCKLRHYMLAFTTVVIAQSDLVKYMLSCPILRGRIGKWILAMSEFSLQYVSQKAVKGQAIADFLAHHPPSELTAFRELEFAAVALAPWTLYFNGSRTDTAAGAGIAIAKPAGDRFSYSFQLDFKCTNNQAEYEALIIGLEILLDLGVREVRIFGDSLLVVNQLVEKFKCLSSSIEPYLRKAFEVLDRFDDVYIEHIPREFNFAANELAQVASGLSLRDGVRERLPKVERRTLPSFIARGQFQAATPEVAALDPIDEDWRLPFIAYLQNPNDAAHSRQIRFLALNFVLRNGELRRRGKDGNDFRCVYGNEAKRVMREVHCGVCGSHQAGPKMRWLIRRHGYYWPTILKDCIAFAKGCQDYQAHGPVQHIPNIPLQPIIKPWSGRGWAIDFVGIIHPHSSEQQKFIIVATDFFTKWVEAKPLKVASANSVRNFIFRYIISRFGIPECIVTDRGAAFMADSVVKYLNDYDIKLLHSTPYYAQSNGQAEASNKVILGILRKMLELNPCVWHEELYHTLWAYSTSKRGPTDTIPYALMYGHDAVLPLEINIASLRVQEQHQLLGEDYVQAMWQELEDLDEHRVAAFNNLILEKQRIARSYDKVTRGQSYAEGQKVWRAVLPLGEKTDGRGKWSARWEGPFIFHRILPKGAYHLRDLDSTIHCNPINGRFLKRHIAGV